MNMITMSTNQFFHHDADQRDNNPQRFLLSLEAKGIITHQSNRSFHERANLINKSSGSWLYITTVASWTRTLYEITKLIHKEQRQEIKAIKIKSALKKTKRDEKRECAKIKRDQTMQIELQSRNRRKTKKEKPKEDTRKTKKQKQEIRNTIRDSLLSQKREKKPGTRHYKRLKEDRATKQSKNRQDTLTRSPQNP
jgi:hypothetical protein